MPNAAMSPTTPLSLLGADHVPCRARDRGSRSAPSKNVAACNSALERPLLDATSPGNEPSSRSRGSTRPVVCETRSGMVRGSARPEDFLELLERSRRGKLKVYLGFAA